jgi:deoxyribonuclease V
VAQASKPNRCHRRSEDVLNQYCFNSLKRSIIVPISDEDALPTINKLHTWGLSPAEAERLQLELAGLVCRENRLTSPRYIAGADISAPDSRGIAKAAVVVLNYPELDLVEVRLAEGRLNFPYVPGLLSFRESPLVLAAWQDLSISPDLLFVDGQGIAHPRRFGIASHLGLLFDIPTIGCAKSRLCGQHGDVPAESGSYVELLDRGEIVGAAVRTKTNAAPVYVSIGHKVDLNSAIDWTIKCCRNHRLPEPSRIAHLAASGKSVSKLEHSPKQRFLEYFQGKLL